MKLIVSAMLLVASFTASAAVVECSSTQFNRTQADFRMSFKVTNENSIAAFQINYDGEVVVKGTNLPGRKYSGSKYKNMMAYDISAAQEQSFDFGDANLTLLAPQGFTKLPKATNFKVIVTNRSSDGGNYDTINCSIK